MTIHLLIQGKVQGVFYRAAAKDVAQQLSLTGWIRNTKDGDVEALATGEKDRLDEFVNWCKKGPSRAEVTKVTITPTATESFSGFDIVG